MRARDIMTTPVHTIGRDAPVQEAADLLAVASAPGVVAVERT